MDLCILPSQQYRSDHGASTTETESTRIRIARLILRMMPKSHLNVVMYFMEFLTKVLKYPSNGMTIGRIAHLFGSAMCSPRGALDYLIREGGHQCVDEALETHDRAPTIDQMDHQAEDWMAAHSKMMLSWMLSYWDEISQGLSDTADGGARTKPLTGTKHDTPTPTSRSVSMGTGLIRRKALSSPLGKELKGATRDDGQCSVT